MSRAVRDLLLRPLAAAKGRWGWIAFALLALTASQSALLLLMKGFTSVLFTRGPADEVLSLAALAPKNVADWLGAWGALTITRSALALAVPLGLLAASLARSYANYVYNFHQQALALELAGAYRARLFEAVLAQPYSEVRRRSPGEWMSVVMNDVLFLQNRFSDVMSGLLRGGVTVVAGIAWMLVIHWPTGLVLLLLAPVAALLMGRTGRRIAVFADRVQRELARLSAAMLDLRGRIEVIRAQGAEPRERARMLALSESYYRMIRRSIMVRSAFAPVMELGGFAVFAVCVAVVAGHGGLGPDLLLQFFTALGLLLKPLREIGEQFARWGETRGALQRSLDLYERMTARKPVTMSAAATSAAATSALASATDWRRIDIAEVRVAYDGVVAFAATELTVSPQRAVAIIGPSGAGKSTLIKTFAGLWTPEAFRASHALDEVVAASAMVSQEPFLFDDTLRANLLYGLASAPDEAAIYAALTVVNIADEVRALPEGLDTRMRALGGTVSGGQTQRLTIARALLRGRPLLLLDEATSAVDERTERDITARLTAACRAEGQALLAVTHRLRFLELYDEVWFVEGGAITRRGAHRALLADERYARYCAAGEVPS